MRMLAPTVSALAAKPATLSTDTCALQTASRCMPATSGIKIINVWPAKADIISSKGTASCQEKYSPSSLGPLTSTQSSPATRSPSPPPQLLPPSLQPQTLLPLLMQVASEDSEEVDLEDLEDLQPPQQTLTATRKDLQEDSEGLAIVDSEEEDLEVSEEDQAPIPILTATQDHLQEDLEDSAEGQLHLQAKVLAQVKAHPLARVLTQVLDQVQVHLRLRLLPQAHREDSEDLVVSEVAHQLRFLPTARWETTSTQETVLLATTATLSKMDYANRFLLSAMLPTF